VNKLRWSRVLTLFAAAGVVAALVWGFTPKPIPVDSISVRLGAIEVTIDDDGETRVRERYAVLSPLTGKLQRIRLHPGDTVTRGESELAIIEPTDPSLLDARARTEAEARVRAMESAKERASEAKEIAHESVELAQREYERGRGLAESNSISASELDQLMHRYRIAGSEVRAANFLIAIADHELALAKAALISTQTSTYESMRLTSPIDGVVLKVFREDAGFVSPGTPLIEIGDPTDMEIQVDVLSTAATRIQPGDHVYIEHWGGAERLLGRVRLVEPSAFLKVSALGVEEKRVNVIIDFDSPWDERKSLGDGFRVEARIVVDRSAEDRPIVPTGALFRDQDRWKLFKIQDGRAQSCDVKPGLTNSRETEIVSGIAPDDVVILYPSERIQDGVRVIANQELRQ
jgi:HlyD family secretion protein